jgi:N,N'-diacetylchitobiose transport system substrate-binding protein
MKRLYIPVVGLIAAFALAVPTATARTGGSAAPAAPARAAANTLTVWLQVDARSGWPELVEATNQAFERRYSGWDVDVQYQNWPDHLQKFDATLVGGNVPDVIEMGNTEMTKYMAAGAFVNLTRDRSSFANSKFWLRGLAASVTYSGKLYGVPYYAGSRVVTYRTDLFRRAKVRIPRSLGQYAAAAAKLRAKNNRRSFSPVYIAGKDWYVAMAFVYDFGGKIAAVKNGKWVGTLDSPKARAGLAAFQRFFNVGSRASRTTIETRPNPYDVYSQGNAASMIGPAWFSCCVGKYKNVTKQFVMPSHIKGLGMPGFLGGSDLAIPVRSNAKAQAKAWIRLFTSTQAERTLQAKKNIPNATNLLGGSVNERAARRSWFVPTAKHWVDVENANVLRTMLARILTRQASISSATKSASATITRMLGQR